MSQAAQAALTGLIHDIGKLYWRAYHKEPPSDFAEEGFTHQDYTAYFARNRLKLNQNLVESAKRHHRSQKTPARLQPRADEPLDWIIFYAHNYASNRCIDDVDEVPSRFEYLPLISVFSQIKLNKVKASERVYPLLTEEKTGFRPSLMYPADPSDSNLHSEAYVRLVNHLEAGLRKLPVGMDIETLLANVNMLFLDTLWSVPANTQVDPGISLYEHLRLTAAFAAALWAFHVEQGLEVSAIRNESVEKFLLVGGDFSGIQGHIYRINEAQGQGGIAKRLRARSLEVSLAAEAMALGLLKRLRLPPLQRIMSAGGKFYLLIPNTDEAQKVLAEHLHEWEAWAMDQGATLRPVLAWVPFSPEELNTAEHGFSDVFKRLAAAMSEAKLRPLASQVSRFQDPFASHAGHGLRPCAICGVRPAAKDEPGATCVECLRDREVGTRLPYSRSIFATTKAPEKPYYRFPYMSFGFGKEGYELRGVVEFNPVTHPWELRLLLGHLPTVGDALRYKDWTLEEYQDFLAEHGLLLDAGDRLNEEKPLTFTELAHLSAGAPYLGALMLDADRMGEAFVSGFDHLKKLQSPGRMAALSRSVEVFFSAEVGSLIKEADRYRKRLRWEDSEAQQKARRYRLIYTVYSGGDDLFLIGPWDVLLDFARDLNELYRQFTGHPGLTLSGGFTLLKPTTPVPMIYEAIHAAEDQAKFKGKDPKSPSHGKGHLALFGHAVPWEELEELTGWADWLRRELEIGRFPGALAYRLLELHQAYEKSDDPARQMFYKPQLSYVLRNYADEEKYPGYFLKLRKLLDHMGTEWRHLPVWVQWGLYGARGGKG